MTINHNNDSSLQQIQAGVDAMSEGFALFDDNDELVFCNAAFKALYRDLAGYLLPGLAWSVFLVEAQRKYRSRALEQLDAHLTSGIDSPITLEAHGRGDRWMRLGIQGVNGGGFVLTQADITDQHQASEILEHADDLLKNILDSCASRIVLSRISDGKLLYRTPAWQQTFGVVQRIQEIFADTVSYTDLLTDILSTGQLDDVESTLTDAGGISFPGRLSSRIIDYQGEPAMIMSTEDMTVLHTQRDEIALINNELSRRREASFQNEKLNALGQLLAGVAHELNNPLSVVVGHAMMLREDVDDPEALESIDKISRSAERCAKIVKTFLAMARQKPARLESADLNEIIELALEIASYGLRKQSVTIDLRLADNLPPVWIDQDQVIQVFINLMINAEHALAATSESPTLKITTLYDSESQRLIARVSDNGPGVPDTLKVRIFEPFFTTKSVNEGTGVGLALSHRIISSHEGVLDLAESEIGGATFTVTLPAAERVESAITQEPVKNRQQTVRILLIEDEPDVSHVMQKLLTGMGATTVSAATAEQGLNLLESDTLFDLILCDLRMPGMSGREMLQVVKSRWPVLAERFVFVTGDAISEDAEAIRNEATHLLIEKPVSPVELQTLIHSINNVPTHRTATE